MRHAQVTQHAGHLACRLGVIQRVHVALSIDAVERFVRPQDDRIVHDGW